MSKCKRYRLERQPSATKASMGSIVKNILIIIFPLLFLSTQVFPENTQITSFSKSKKLLLKLYKDHPFTLYCGCSYKGKKPNLSSCGYIPKKDKKRANRIEWEHVVPAHAFGQSFSEWRNGHPKCVKKNGKKFKGRKCAEKMNEEYRRMQSDMFNLYPAIGEVNGSRSEINGTFTLSRCCLSGSSYTLCSE